MIANPRGRARFEWIEAALAATDLAAGEKVVCARLGLHLNDETGLCNPSFERLRGGTGFKEVRSVKRVVASLVHKGWITYAENCGGNGNSNEYFLVLPPSRTVGTVTEKTPLDATATVTTGEPNGALSAPKRCPARHPNNKKNNKGTSRGEFSSSNFLSRQSEAPNGKAARDYRASKDEFRSAHAELKAIVAADQDSDSNGGQAIRLVAAARRRRS